MESLRVMQACIFIYCNPPNHHSPSSLHTPQVNVYSVGLYLESSYLYKLKGFKGKAKDALAKVGGFQRRRKRGVDIAAARAAHEGRDARVCLLATSPAVLSVCLSPSGCIH